MYEFTTLERPSVPAGASLLLVGADAGTGRERLCDALGEAGDSEAVLVVSTAATAETVDALRDRTVAADALGVVDASGAGLTLDRVAESTCVEGPDALPALGVAISDRLDRLGHRYDRVRVGVDSVSDLLAAREVPAVFRFLHVLGGRINSADATLVATLDGSAHDAETRRTIAELFDDTIDVE